MGYERPVWPSWFVSIVLKNGDRVNLVIEHELVPEYLESCYEFGVLKCECQSEDCYINEDIPPEAIDFVACRPHAKYAA